MMEMEKFRGKCREKTNFYIHEYEMQTDTTRYSCLIFISYQELYVIFFLLTFFFKLIILI